MHRSKVIPTRMLPGKPQHRPIPTNNRLAKRLPMSRLRHPSNHVAVASPRELVPSPARDVHGIRGWGFAAQPRGERAVDEVAGLGIAQGFDVGGVGAGYECGEDGEAG